MSFKVKTTIEIEEQRIKDLLCGAFEGGSNYWYNIKRFDVNSDKEYQFKHIEVPFS